MVCGMDARGLGPYLATLRTLHGWGLTEAAARIDVSKSHLSQIEGGKIGLPNAALRRRIAAAYGIRHVDILVAAGELVPDEVAPPPSPVLADPRLREIVANWPRIRDATRTSLANMFRDLMTDPHVLEDEEDNPVVALAR
jgi:transcriptional regulator with XRE-family HTH domain